MELRSIYRRRRWCCSVIFTFVQANYCTLLHFNFFVFAQIMYSLLALITMRVRFLESITLIIAPVSWIILKYFSYCNLQISDVEQISSVEYSYTVGINIFLYLIMYKKNILRFLQIYDALISSISSISFQRPQVRLLIM